MCMYSIMEGTKYGLIEMHCLQKDTNKVCDIVYNLHLPNLPEDRKTAERCCALV